MFIRLVESLSGASRVLLAITVGVHWIGRLVGERVAHHLARAAGDQARVDVQGLAHLVAYDVYQLLEHRLRRSSWFAVNPRYRGAISLGIG